MFPFRNSALFLLSINALTCEFIKKIVQVNMVKKLDDVYVCFENNGKMFRDYNSAYYNSKHCSCKRVNYVFTPTMEICKNVGELERVSRLYFSRFDCDYIDLVNKQSIKQISILN